MTRILLLLLTALSLSATAQKKEIVIGTTDSVHSAILNETRPFMVYVPNRGNSIFSEQKYPVVYLLDGDSHFHAVSGIIQDLSVNNGVIPQMIVVAIPNTDRTRDLTPTHSTRSNDGKEVEYLRSSGGAEKFTSFIEQELMPYVESHYPTLPHKALIGHSFGGLFVMNTLVYHPQLFNTYIAIDPSMWWDRNKLLDACATALRSDKLKGRSLYVGIANTMPAGMDTTRAKKDTTGVTAHIRSIFKLTAIGKSIPPGGLRFGWKYYGSDSHGSVPLVTEYDGLRFIYDFYNSPQGDPAKVTPELISSRYKTIADKMGIAIPPPEPVINSYGYNFLQQKEYDKAFAFFKMNIDNYPGSANVYDSMGDYYLDRADKAKAKEYFLKAISIKEFPETRKKLNELK